MAVKVRIPTPLRAMTKGADLVEGSGASVRALIDDLERRHTGLKGRICDANGALRRFVNLYINSADVRTLGGIDAPVKDGDLVEIVPAIAGGKTEWVPPWQAAQAAATPAPAQAANATSYPQLLSKLRSTIPEVTPVQVASAMSSGRRVIVVDVREGEEWRAGHITGAISVPKGYLEQRIEEKVPDKNAEVILYCAGGVRSLFAAESIQRYGYTNVKSMTGGFNRWNGEGLAVTKPHVLTAHERKRYARHLTIPEVGEAGQVKLFNAKVLLIGVGGLGSPAAYYLAAAGVGTLGLIDFDVVDESNLQRQILHKTSSVGMPKIKSATETLKSFNPDVNIVPFEERLDRTNVERVFKDFDVIVDGSDNFQTRYLTNDACVKLGKPNVHGSVYRFEGQATVFAPSMGGPCYRCLYPEPPPPELAPSCAEAGVLGVLPGLVGLIEAIETIKLICGIGQPLVGRLTTYDAVTGSFRELKLFKDPECAYCAPGKPFPGYIDYDGFCNNVLLS